MSSSLNITGVFSRALKIYRQHWGMLLLCALLIYTVPTVLTVVLLVIRPDAGDGIAIVGLLLVIFMSTTGGFWFRAFCTNLILAKRRNHPVVARELVRRTFRGFPRVSTVGFLVWFGTIGGLLLLIVPGLIFAARRAPALSVAVVEGKGAFYGKRFKDPQHSAMHRSKELVAGTGNSFEMFSVIAAKNIVYGTLNSLIPFLAVLFVVAVPWGALAVSLSYFELVDIERHGFTPDAEAGAAQATPLASHDSSWRPGPLQGE